MKLFGWKSGREESRPALSRGVATFGTGSVWPSSYEAQVREGYCRNAVAQRAVRLVAEGVGSAPLVASHPRLVELATGRSGGQVLVEVAAAQLLLHGNAYVQVLRDAEGGVAELYALRPERVSVELDAGGWPAAYRYKVGERTTRLRDAIELGEAVMVTLPAAVGDGWRLVQMRLVRSRVARSGERWVGTSEFLVRMWRQEEA